MILLSLFLKIKKNDFIFLIFLIAFVLILELINTIFERLIDILKPRIHEYSKEVKNIASAVVLLGAIISAVIGLIILSPYLLNFIFQYV